MPNTSATGGFLTPSASPAPLEDAALDRFLQQFVANVSGMTPSNVRPRWQKEPPNMPPVGSDWAAVGVQDMRSDMYPAELHKADSDGSNTVFSQEQLDVLVSFYGDNARRNAAILRDGLFVAQNREWLIYNDMGLVTVGSLTPAPSLVNERWQYRIDFIFTLVRAVRRTYPVLNLLSAEGTIVTDTDPPLSEPINTP